MSDHPEYQMEMRRWSFKFMCWWYVVLCIYLGKAVWEMWEALRWKGAIPLGLLLGTLLVAMFRLGWQWRKLVDLWDEEGQRAAQAKRDEQTVLREQARLIEERERAEIRTVVADLEALHGELGE